MLGDVGLDGGVVGTAEKLRAGITDARELFCSVTLVCR
jgi:hypothetical protein